MDPPRGEWLAHSHGKGDSLFGKLVLATHRRRSQPSIKVSGRCMVGALTTKRNRSGRSRRGLREPATASEEESEADLDLAARVGEVAVGVGDAAERRVEGQRGSGCRAADQVTRVVDAGDVLVVEEVEGLAENLGAVPVTEANLLGEAQVHIDGALHLEGIAADEVDALAAIGTVHTPTERLGGDGGDVAGDGVSSRAESN